MKRIIPSDTLIAQRRYADTDDGVLTIWKDNGLDGSYYVTKGRNGSGSLQCAINMGELICGGEVVDLTKREVEWLEAIADSLEDY